jgi:hypothetical protein
MHPGETHFDDAGGTTSFGFSFADTVAPVGGKDLHSISMQWRSPTGVPVTMNSGTFNYIHDALATNYTETIGGVLTLNSGASTIRTDVANTANSSILTFGSLVRTVGASVNFGGGTGDAGDRIQMLNRLREREASLLDSGVEYEVAWANIAKLELFEQMVLAEFCTAHFTDHVPRLTRGLRAKLDTLMEAFAEAQASADRYDPSTDTFLVAGSLNQARADAAAAALLADGTAVVLGGDDENGDALQGGEIYQTDQDLFVLTAGTPITRVGATATRLQSDLVLIAGGSAIGIGFGWVVLRTWGEAGDLRRLADWPKRVPSCGSPAAKSGR